MYKNSHLFTRKKQLIDENRSYTKKFQQIEFDSPPKFSLIERTMVFEVPDGFKLYLIKLEAPTIIGGFILQYGYFKTSGKFFYVSVFNSEDIEAVCRWNEIDKNIID